MWSIILALVIGVILGYFHLLPPGISRLMSRFTTSGVVLLLFLMGGQIGSDAEIIAGLGQMGLQAFFYALAAIGGSILAVKALEAVVSLGPEKRERGGGI